MFLIPLVLCEHLQSALVCSQADRSFRRSCINVNGYTLGYDTKWILSQFQGIPSSPRYAAQTWVAQTFRYVYSVLNITIISEFARFG
jgi:hypothetical protein